MCGFFATQIECDKRSLSEILNKHLRFRGPDYYSGILHYKGWLIAHARLSIIEGSYYSNQPYQTSNGILLFNGEILNFQDLAKKYGINEQKSDTVLLATLIEKNMLFINELEGFFSFVYIDDKGSLQHCVKDKFGVKPLYYNINADGHYTICSEPAVIQKVCGLPVNNDALAEYKYFRAPIISDSYFKNVSSVKPGTCLVDGKYFDIYDCFVDQSYSNVELDEVEEILLRSVSQRLISDAECGLLFSGGVDSNIINEITNHELERFCAISSKEENIDSLRSQEIDTHRVVLEADKFKSLFSKMLQVRGEPLSVPNEVLLANIANLARSRGIKVLLSGEAADEFFGGYDRIFRYFSLNEFNIIKFFELYCYSEAVLDDERIINYFRKYFDKLAGFPAFEKVRFFFVDIHLPLLFRRLDFSLMFGGVEGREPLATESVFRCALCFTEKELMNDHVGKVPLRRLLERKMGYEFAFSQKVGFPVDVKEIFQDTSKHTAYEIWQEANLRELKWL